MGCDIHLCTEIKVGGQWHTYSHPSMQRSYALFAKMAGVLNWPDSGIEPISEPRGIPDDAAFVTRFCWEAAWGHSPSWVRAQEIAELAEFIKERVIPERPWAVEREFWGYFFGNPWEGWLTYPEDYPEGIEDVRFVFWFDS